MATVEVFDPPMCCSTGVCGPSVDPALAEFAADLGWLAEQGARVQRHNLSQEPAPFAESSLVRELLAERGEESLPVVVVDGELRSSGRHPSREELAAWALSAAASPPLDAATAELVALGAAVGANCEPCFTHHYNEARRLGCESRRHGRSGGRRPGREGDPGAFDPRADTKARRSRLVQPARPC